MDKVDTLETPVELAKRLHTNTSTLAYWRHIGSGPRFLKIGRRVAYRASDVDRWLETRVMQSTAEK